MSDCDELHVLWSRTMTMMVTQTTVSTNNKPVQLNIKYDTYFSVHSRHNCLYLPIIICIVRLLRYNACSRAMQTLHFFRSKTRCTRARAQILNKRYVGKLNDSFSNGKIFILESSKENCKKWTDEEKANKKMRLLISYTLLHHLIAKQ